jgi:hypothetical protein
MGACNELKLMYFSALEGVLCQIKMSKIGILTERDFVYKVYSISAPVSIKEKNYGYYEKTSKNYV